MFNVPLGTAIDSAVICPGLDVDRSTNAIANDAVHELELVTAGSRDDRTILARPEQAFAVEHMELDRRRDPEAAAARRNRSQQRSHVGFAGGASRLRGREIGVGSRNRRQNSNSRYLLLDSRRKRRNRARVVVCGEPRRRR